jgi:hypothetical protein
MTAPEAKEIERNVILWARQKSTLIPSGDLQEFEKPDWLIPTASLAIEVSMLLPRKPEGALFSPQQVSTFQEHVVAEAERIYRESGGPQPIDVLVFFNNDWTRKRDPKLMARVLAECVWTKYPTDGRIVQLDDTTPDGFSLVRIACFDGGWHTSASNSIELVTHERLSASIANKDQRVPEYRKRVPPGWQIWLLLATSPSVLWSVSTPREVGTWRFTHGFDRVLLHSWEHGVVELSS